MLSSQLSEILASHINLSLSVLLALSICLLLIYHKEYNKQRELSEFHNLDKDFKLFQNDLRSIKNKGTLSRREYVQYLNKHLAEIETEIQRRKVG